LGDENCMLLCTRKFGKRNAVHACHVRSLHGLHLLSRKKEPQF
jgi:hypothetical protein